jgi:hypothetical protein
MARIRQTAVVSRAKDALWKRFAGTADAKGYTTPEENLLPGIEFAAVKRDLERGDGNELKAKFRAVHSSSALAVNSFGPFKTRPGDLVLLRSNGADRVEFETPLRIFRGGRAPNLDVWIDRGTEAIAIESKCLEHLTPKTPAFSTAYDRLTPPWSEPCWWQLYEDAQRGDSQHLDRAQLIKHYFGLRAFYRRNPGVALTLLYLFWEPLNWREVNVCVRHRSEIEAFATTVSDAEIRFRWQTYEELWDAWAKVPELADHARNLQRRYQVDI